jgi:hypothetical protein
MPNKLIKQLCFILASLLLLTSISANAAVKVGSYFGNWSAKINYGAGDLITFNDKTFLSLIPRNLNKSPDTNPPFWQLLGGVGLQGVPGAIGATGPQGQVGAKGESGSQGLQGNQGAPGAPQAGIDVGDMQYWDGANWVMIPAPNPLPIAPAKSILTFCNGMPTWQRTCQPSDGIYLIGDNGPAGGKVFYITDGGLHGLEAAPVDQASSGVFWGCQGAIIAGASSQAVGTGATNTSAIVASCNETNIAARIADDYILNGYTDWFLPSIDELNLLYEQRYVVGGFASGYYWSSTEYSSTLAWSRNFNNMDQNNYYKNAIYPIRAVRYF